MSKTFRAWKIDEPLFLPPMVGDFVAKDHLARFVLSLVRDDLGLGDITGTYGSPSGWGRLGSTNVVLASAEEAMVESAVRVACRNAAPKSLLKRKKRTDNPPLS